MMGGLARKSSLKKAKTHRFEVSKTDGLVYDNKYNIEWIVLSKTLPDLPNLSFFSSSTTAESDFLSAALSATISLIRELGYGWRLPTTEELESFGDDGVGYRSWDPFENVYATAILSADGIGFSNFGSVLFCTDHDEIPCLQVFAVRPRCETERLSIENSWKSAMIADEYRKQEAYNNLVKGKIARKQWEPFFEGRFLCNDTTSIIYDSLTGLEWRVGPDRKTSYEDADSWINALGDGWNMPNRGQLMDLLIAGVSNKDWGPFRISASLVWSQSYIDRGSSEAWSFSFDASTFNKGEYGGREYLNSTNKSGGIRAFAVRKNLLNM